MLEKIGAKFHYRTFIGNSTNDVCELCNQTFDWKHKQHQCKRCLRYVCYNCGPDKIIILSYDLKIPHRICQNCKDDLKHQTQQIEAKKCKFGYLSEIGKKWANIAQGDNFQIEKAQEEYLKSLPTTLKNARNETKNQIQTNLQRFYKENKKTLNYSLYDWNYKMCLGEQEIYILTKISNVLHCFFEQNPIKLTRNLVFITTYFLYFCDEAICLSLLLFLHQKVIPSRIQYHKLDSEEFKAQEVKLLMDYIQLLSNTEIDALLKSKIKVFFEAYSIDILTTLMFNHLEFYVGYFFFNQLLINREFSIYEKFLANICLESQKIIIDVQIDDIPNSIIKNIQLDQLTTFLQMEDKQKTNNKNSLINRDQLNQQSQINIPIKQEIIIEQQSINDNSLEQLLDTFIEFLKDNQYSKIENMILDQNYAKNKNQIQELYQIIKNQNEKLQGLRNSLNQLKQDQDLESDPRSSRISKNSIKLDGEGIINLQAQSQQKNNKDEFNTNNNLNVQYQLKEDNIQIQIKAYEQKEKNYIYQISQLHSEISNLKFQINNQQIQLQQKEFENQQKEKINNQYEQEIFQLKEEQASLLKKTSMIKQQSSYFSIKNHEQEQEIQELRKQFEEQKKNTEEMILLYSKQNEQQLEKLNKQIDDLNVQLLGLKRKDFNQNQTNIELNIIKELQQNNIQIRNTLLQKEKELFNLKQKFVEMNQLKIQYFDQMQNYEKINKEIDQTLKLYEGKEIHQLKSFYDEKIQLLEKNHEEQMNRLLLQFQQYQPNYLDQKTINQQQQLKEIQQEKKTMDQQQQDQSIGQIDDCTIF